MLRDAPRSSDLHDPGDSFTGKPAQELVHLNRGTITAATNAHEPR